MYIKAASGEKLTRLYSTCKTFADGEAVIVDGTGYKRLIVWLARYTAGNTVIQMDWCTNTTCSGMLFGLSQIYFAYTGQTTSYGEFTPPSGYPVLYLLMPNENACVEVWGVE